MLKWQLFVIWLTEWLFYYLRIFAQLMRFFVSMKNTFDSQFPNYLTVQTSVVTYYHILSLRGKIITTVFQ